GSRVNKLILLDSSPAFGGLRMTQESTKRIFHHSLMMGSGGLKSLKLTHMQWCVKSQPPKEVTW
ncbi:hypothetical protein KKA47_06340, partial [bacterium]|nr:hypothetical protein [bacterium]